MSITTRAVPDANAELIAELAAQVVTTKELPTPRERTRIREKAGVSRRAIARACGVTVATVIKWEKGAQPRPAHAVVYHAALKALEQAAS